MLPRLTLTSSERHFEQPNNDETIMPVAPSGRRGTIPASPGGGAASSGAGRNPFVLRQNDGSIHEGIPLDVIEGLEWVRCCYASAPFVHKSADAQSRFERHVQHRLRKLRPFEHRILLSLNLYYPYVRWWREVTYVSELAAHIHDPEFKHSPLVWFCNVFRPPAQNPDRRFLSYLNRQSDSE